jgi:hypothetical protein
LLSAFCHCGERFIRSSRAPVAAVPIGRQAMARHTKTKEPKAKLDHPSARRPQRHQRFIRASSHEAPSRYGYFRPGFAEMRGPA